MNYILLVISFLCNVSLAVFDKKSSTKISGNNQVLTFSFLKTFFCFLFALAFLPLGEHHITKIGVFIALLGGVAHAVSVILIMRCLKKTKAVYVNLVMSSGIIFPAFYGFIFLNQAFSFLKLFFLLFLIFAMALTLSIKVGEKFNLMFLIPMFISYGVLMTVQGVFPKYCENGSKMFFSVIMYGFSALILGVATLIKVKEFTPFKKDVICICVWLSFLNLALNVLLTTVSASLPAIIVFPSVHGLKLVVITLISSFLWKEKLTKLQYIGCLLSTVCICVLSV